MIQQRPVVQHSQEMRLKLSQQNILALSMLAQTSMELKASIQEALETNPALEVRDEPWEDSLERLQERLDGDELVLRDAELSAELTEALNLEVPPEEPFQDLYPKLSNLEKSAADLTYYDTQSATDLGEPSFTDSVQTIIERTLSTSEDLRSHLREQVVWAKVEPTVKELAYRLIENLDGNGFHIVDPKQLLQEGESEDTLRQAMDLVRGLDPIGTCTKDWQESLVVQMEKLGGFSEEAIRLVRDHPDLLLRPVPREIARVLGIDLQEVSTVLDEIKTLNPFPGKEYDTQSAPEIYPDLFVEERDGEFYVTMNDEVIPVIGLNQDFVSEAQDEGLDRESKAFIRRKVREANEFIQRVLFRQNTLLKVGHAICRHQTEFLRKGPAYLKPLVLSEIAQEVGVHPSTVSRATNGKYIQTRWGILELKDFFTRPSGTGNHSRESIKERMKEVIDRLAKQGGRVTDARIRQELAQQGVEIALRTVNKYRRELENENG